MPGNGCLRMGGQMPICTCITIIYSAGDDLMDLRSRQGEIPTRIQA